MFTAVNHGYINQQATCISDTDLNLLTRIYHRPENSQELTKMKAFIMISVLLTVTLVSLSHVYSSEEGRRKKASNVTKLLGDDEQLQSNMQVHNILAKGASRWRRLALKNAIMQFFEEAQAQVHDYVDKDLLFQVINDGARHPIPDCSFKNSWKKQLKEQVGYVKLNGIEYVLLYYFYYVHRFEDPIRIPRNKLT